MLVMTAKNVLVSIAQAFFFSICIVKKKKLSGTFFGINLMGRFIQHNFFLLKFEEFTLWRKGSFLAWFNRNGMQKLNGQNQTQVDHLFSKDNLFLLHVMCMHVKQFIYYCP